MVANSISPLCEEIRRVFDAAVARNLADTILLSGGLDTSVVVATASRHKELRGITVALGEAPDIRFSKLIAEKFQVQHRIVSVDEEQAREAVHEVVTVMKSFDTMEIRNDISILIALKAAKEAGTRAVMTGDGGDELFGGYSFLFRKTPEERDRSLREMWKIMRFASIPLAASLGMKAKLPFLDDEFKDFAMKIPAELKIREERGSIYGKWILRKAFEAILPEVIVWRVKMPIEQGSGSAALTTFFKSYVQDDEFNSKKTAYEREDGVKLRDKEHLYYYESYREVFGSPKGSGEGSKICTGCGGNVPDEMNYCRTCGAYPV